MSREPDIEALLRPSLTEIGRRRSLFSLQALFLTAFFGGVPALVGLSLANSYRLNRLKVDLAPAAAAVLAWLVVMQQLYGACGNELCRWMTDLPLPPGVLVRALSLLLCGGAVWLHRREQRACDLAGLPRPNGTWPGLVAIVAGYLLTQLLLAFLQAPQQ
ncbi:hypothetical protein [Pelomonas sp. SE-A7]|uniref:hypothetical protein n=1 Tax=Pelomonas sp. SE-A7 TaxID=3054953 RepID=UPI00259CA2D4|nr:hypothetical protein [Pelomonas sp. SE-A7]MDM4768440.1 hypothetical protein [Pelomonas sp. SE-A7]